MSVSDNNTKAEGGTATTQPTMASVDVRELVGTIVGALESRQQRPATQQEVDYAGALVRDLNAQGFDKDFIAAQLHTSNMTTKQLEQLWERKERERDAKEQQKAIGALQGRAESFIEGMLAGYRQDLSDSQAEKFDDLEGAIRVRIAEKYNADTRRTGDWQRGILHERDLRKIIDETVNGYATKFLSDGKNSGSKNKEGPLKSTTGKGMSANTKSQDKSDPEDDDEEDGGTTTDLAGLDEHQRAFYHSTVSNLVNFVGKKPKKAAKIALERAQALKAPVLRAR